MRLGNALARAHSRSPDPFTATKPLLVGSPTPDVDGVVVARFLKMPRDPNRPLAISLVVADEEILLRWGVVLSHKASELYLTRTQTPSK